MVSVIAKIHLCFSEIWVSLQPMLLWKILKIHYLDQLKFMLCTRTTKNVLQVLVGHYGIRFLSGSEWRNTMWLRQRSSIKVQELSWGKTAPACCTAARSQSQWWSCCHENVETCLSVDFCLPSSDHLWGKEYLWVVVYGLALYVALHMVVKMLLAFVP